MAVVFQLKTQLTETLRKLETEESERQKVAGDLYKVKHYNADFKAHELLDIHVFFHPCCVVVRPSSLWS